LFQRRLVTIDRFLIFYQNEPKLAHKSPFSLPLLFFAFYLRDARDGFTLGESGPNIYPSRSFCQEKNTIDRFFCAELKWAFVAHSACLLSISRQGAVSRALLGASGEEALR
jgi:hypothetical protein